MDRQSTHSATPALLWQSPILRSSVGKLSKLTFLVTSPTPGYSSGTVLAGPGAQTSPLCFRRSLQSRNPLGKLVQILGFWYGTRRKTTDNIEKRQKTTDNVGNQKQRRGSVLEWSSHLIRCCGCSWPATARPPNARLTIHQHHTRSYMAKCWRRSALPEEDLPSTRR